MELGVRNTIAHRYVYLSGMTGEKPGNDKMFMNSDLSHMRPISYSGVRDQYDQSGFFRNADITGRFPADHCANSTAASAVFRPQDTVHLSSRAQAQVSGDVDHDGDSH